MDEKMHFHVMVWAYKEVNPDGSFRGTQEIDVKITGALGDIMRSAVNRAKQIAPEAIGYYVRSVVEHDGTE